MYKLLAFSLCLCLPSAMCAKILAVFIFPSISHQVVFQPIWRELSLRGHEVTVLSPNPLNDTKPVNLTEIDLGLAYEIIIKYPLQKLIIKDLPLVQIVKSFFELLGNIAKAELSHPPVQELIKDPSKRFDVLLVEFLHPTMYALSARFNCPMIGMTSLDTLIVGHDAVGNPSHPGLNPNFILPFMKNLEFFERIRSAFHAVWFRYYYYYYYVVPEKDKVAKEYISENIQYLGDIEKNVSLLFLNVNPILHPIRPNVPAIIELGNMHLKVKNPLSTEIPILFGNHKSQKNERDCLKQTQMYIQRIR